MMTRGKVFLRYTPPAFLLNVLILAQPHAVNAAEKQDLPGLSFDLRLPYPYRTYRLARSLAYDGRSILPEGRLNNDHLRRFYSSLPFPNSENTRNVFLEVDLPKPQPVNEIVLSARTLADKPIGFPAAYRFSFQMQDNSWTSTGPIAIQPDANGNVFIDLSRSFYTSSIRMTPVQLGVDNFGIHYFQMVGVHPGYAPVDGDTGLTCWIPGISASLPTQTRTLTSDDIASTIGVSEQLGGIGTNFILTHKDTEIDILAQGSDGGAGWSTTYYTQSQNGPSISYNQGAGNQRQMWGMHVDLHDLTQTGWIPIYSDHLQPHGNFSGPSKGTSPCDPSSAPILDDDGQLRISGRIALSPQGKKTLHWENSYSYRARHEESFSKVEADQALYLDRTVAHNGDMKIFLEGRSFGWSALMNPVDLASFRKFAPGGCGQTNCGGCNANGCGAHTSSLEYAALIYRVGGVDIAIVIHRTDRMPMQAQINLKTARSCTLDDYSCGNVNFHTWLDPDAFHPPEGHFSSGEVRSYSVSYEIGTIDALRDAGYLVDMEPRDNDNRTH